MLRRYLALAICAVLGALAFGSPAGAVVDGVEFDVTIAGESVADASASSPLRLRDNEDTTATLVVTNGSTEPVTIEMLRLDGQVAGLVFFGYLARVDLTVAPGATESQDLLLDLGGLASQATGQVPAEVRLIAPDGSTVAERTFHADVDGSTTSTYGLFGIVVALITAFLLITSIARLLRGTLPPNRWSRAVRFGVCGVGVGMTLAYAASAFRLLTPTAGTGIAFVVLCAGVGFAFGYLSPTPGRDRIDEDDQDVGPLAPVQTPSTS